MIQTLIALGLTSMMMFIHMDMNVRLMKQNETGKVDSELIHTVNDMRRNVAAVTGDINNLVLAAPIGTNNLKLTKIYSEEVTYDSNGYYSLRIKADFERRNVYGPKTVKRDLGRVYCKHDTYNLTSACLLTNESYKVVTAPPAEHHGDDQGENHNGDKDGPCNR